MDNTTNEIFQPRLDLSAVHAAYNAIVTEMAKVIVGQEKLVEQLVLSVFCGGHVLLEGLPGVAKTLNARCLAKTIDAQFGRIQFTPDLMPSDVLGTVIFSQKNSEFEFKRGPIFANIVLIDEINRSPAKTQAALFECMEEQQVTVDGMCYELADPFLIIATQNPIDHEGTYRLPEAQLDRFLFKLFAEYPNAEHEMAILARHQNQLKNIDISAINKMINAETIAAVKATIAGITVKEDILRYITELVQATRNHPSIYYGASPRASVNLLKSAKALAAVNGRDFVIPEDVKELAFPVLNHRIILTPEKEMEGQTVQDVLKLLIDKVSVPQ